MIKDTHTSHPGEPIARLVLMMRSEIGHEGPKLQTKCRFAANVLPFLEAWDVNFGSNGAVFGSHFAKRWASCSNRNFWKITINT